MKILTAVMNPIAYDGRVLRATEAIAGIADVRLVCPAGDAEPGELPFEVEAVRLPAGFGSRFLEHPAFWWRVLRAAMRSRPDVIYMHDHYLAPVGAVAAWMLGVPLVYDAHELAIPEAGFRMAWQDRLKYLFDRIGVRRADLVISTGKERAAAVRDFYKLDSTPLVIRNIAREESHEGLAQQDDRFPAALSGSDVACIHVYEGHVTLERGLDRFVQAMQYLPPEHHLLVVGDGPHLDALRELASGSGTGQRVHFTGRVPRQAVHGIIRRCHVGVMCYSWNGLNNIYCTPNKVFEYARAGLPMVSTAQPTLEGYVKESGIGHLVPRDADGREYARQMQRVFEERELLASRLPAFLAQYRWEDEEQRLVQAFRKLLDDGERSTG